MFLGQYTLEVIDDRIPFPWDMDTTEPCTWYLSEAPDRKNLILYITPDDVPDQEFDHILEEDVFTLDARGQWQLPQTFLDYLGDRDIVICGVNEYFEVYAEDYFDLQLQMMDELFDTIDLDF